MNAPVPEPHPDDEQLSAHLDGPAEPALTRHLAVCGRCTDRLEEFRAVMAGLAAARAVPPPVIDDRASGALAAARRAWEEERATAPPLAEGGAGVPGPPPDLVARAPASAPGTTPIPLAARRRRAPAWALGVAAAVALVLGVTAVALQNGDSGGGDSGDFAAAPPAQDTTGGPESLTAPTPAPATGSADQAAEAPADQMAAADTALADLGDHRDLSALTGLARRALAAPRAVSEPGPSPVDGNTGSGPSGVSPVQAATAPCAPEAARAVAPTAGPAGYVATLRYRDAPAVLHAFAAAAPDGSSGGRLVVMALADCRVLGDADL